MARTLARIAHTLVKGQRLIERIRFSILLSKVLPFWAAPYSVRLMGLLTHPVFLSCKGIWPDALTLSKCVPYCTGKAMAVRVNSATENEETRIAIPRAEAYSWGFPALLEHDILGG